MKTLTDDAVKDVAIDLINKNGKTTTLEIKKELRNQHYFATQTNVSAVMDSIYIAIGLDFTNKG